MAQSDVITSTHFLHGWCFSTKPNGTPLSTPFVKFVLRVTHAFPVDTPDRDSLCAGCGSEYEAHLTEIDYRLRIICDDISTCLTAKRRVTREPRQAMQDEPIITRGELTRLWQERQSEAVDIINNDSKRPTCARCSINTDRVHEHFQTRCQRVLAQIPPAPWKDDVHVPPPDWTPPPLRFNEKEVVAIISSLPARRSPGADGVTYDYVKRCKQSLAPVLTAIMNICAMNRRIPTDWKHSIITLVPKKNGDPNNIEDWRPISLLCTSYKIYMKLIQQKLVPWIVDTQRLSRRQKGSMPRNGLQEHVFTLKADITDFLHTSSKLYVTFIDIKDAFGSIDHKMMLNEMAEAGYPEQIISITKDIYTESTFQVKTARGLTKPITRGRGIIQGCPWSVLIFEQGIDKWLRWIEQGSPAASSPNPVQGYVDDVDMTATSEADAQAAAAKTCRFMTHSGMEVKHRKCAVLHGQRTGNNWSRRDSTASTELVVQHSSIPIFDREQPYTYLGHQINMAATSEEAQVDNIVGDLNATMAMIDLAPLAVAAKLQAINVMATSKLHFYFPNIIFTDKVLDTIEDTMVHYIRTWLDLNKSSTRCFMFSPRSEGGLGIFHPRSMYYAKKLSFMLSVLNSDDEQTRHTARTSLALHLTKRKCAVVSDGAADDQSFAGYKTDAKGRLLKASKVTWRRSQWIHLNELCVKLGVRLHLMNDQYVLRFCPDEDIQMTFSDPKAFFTSFKRHQLRTRLEAWRQLECQGRLARVTNTDHSLSSSHLTNMHLSDALVKFVIKARLQLLECNARLHTYYPDAVPQQCPRCGFFIETVSHLLNGCRESKTSIRNRHNRVLDIISKAVKDANQRADVFVDSPVTPSKFDDFSSNSFDGISHNRPDICIIDKITKSCLIAEVAVPFDVFLDDCYSNKFDKYFPLSQRIADLGYSCKIFVLLVGSLGLVHRRFVSGLKLLGVSPIQRARAIAKYCSVSAIIGSRIIWKERCKDSN